MARNLRFWLTAPEAAPFDPGDAPLALGALLLRAAKTDSAALLAMPGIVEAVLARRYDLTASEASEMLETCARVEAEAPQGPRFAALLHAVVHHAERHAVAQCLSDVADARGLSLPGDPTIPDLAERFLGVPASDIATSRKAG